MTPRHPSRWSRLLVLAVALGSLSVAPGRAGPDATEVLHGYPVADPYRTLETEAGAAAWIRVQNRKTQAYLREKGSPEAERRLEDLLSIGVVSSPAVAGGRILYQRRDGDQEQPILVWRRGDREVPLVDPNKLSKRGEVALDWFFPSRSGKLLAYGLSKDGDEESVLRVMAVDGGRDLGLEIPHTRACGLSWLPDDSGFYYTRYPGQGGLYHRKVYLHRMGEDPARDTLVFGEGREKTDWPSPVVSDDGERVFVQVSQGWSRSELYMLDHGTTRAVRLFGGEDARVENPTWARGKVYALTNFEASRWKLVRFDPGRPQVADWETIVSEGEGVLEDYRVVGDHLVVHRVVRAVSRLTIFDLDGRSPREVTLPALGSVEELGGERARGPAVFSFSSYFYPPAVMALDPETAAVRVVTQVEAGVATDEYVVEQVDYPSFDGTWIPMFLVHRKDMVRSGDQPTLLTGYGGFNVSLRPGFQRNLLFWLEHGGVFAVANLRGGGELGESWHRAGKREKKFQVFLDFEYAMRFLVRSGITRPARLGIQGGSNGGLLVGAMITRAPHLFAAAIGSVGLYDMIRYHRFPPAELWVDEYGNPEESTDIGYLLGYSPYHQVVDGVRYPAVLLPTADKDTRVHWMHTAKFAARLQEAQAGPAPILFQLKQKQGHGAGKGRSDIIQDYRDRYAFLFSHLKVPGRPPREEPR